MTDELEAYRQRIRREERLERIGEGQYRMLVPEARMIFEVDRVRRESSNLWCELTVRTDLPGAFVLPDHDNLLSIDPLNLSAPRSRQERAKHLASRMRVRQRGEDGEDGIDYVGLLEYLAMLVIAAEREGEPAVYLTPRMEAPPDATRIIDGFPLLMKHPMILFGDGGSMKSLLALYFTGRLLQQGIRVGYFDWELSQDDQEWRLGQMFGPNAPKPLYRRFYSPLIEVAPQIRKDVEREKLEYIVFDSLSVATHDAPESAVSALAYFQALRSIGVGSLHVAHIAAKDAVSRNGKPGSPQNKKPFGSSFWFNIARSCWYVIRSESAIAAYNSKAAHNSPRMPPLGWNLSLRPGRITLMPGPIIEPDLVEGLPLKDRMVTCLQQSGPLKCVDLADELGEKNQNGIRKTLLRDGGRTFTKVKGADNVFHIALRERPQ
jgi:hypothetical protein